MGKELFTATQFIEAIPGTGGIVSKIADKVGCTWHTAKKYIDTYTTIRQAYDDECERVLDVAESAVIKAIMRGETSDAKWYLTKKGKHRGYVDSRQDITTNDESLNDGARETGQELNRGLSALADALRERISGEGQ